jgi:hypothetical protein
LWCHSHNYFSPASARHWQILFQAIGTQLVAIRLMIFINIMKIVSNALENHNGMGEIDPDTPLMVESRVQGCKAWPFAAFL